MYLVYHVIEYSCAQQPSEWAVTKVESYYILKNQTLSDESK